jgi:predicted restriction endonuclease
MTWLEEIIDALKHLGGVAKYDDIYSYIEKNTKRTLSQNWQATIRDAIENNSSDSKKFKGRDLFFSVEGIGQGVWGLRSELKKTPKAEDLGIIEEETKLPERTKTEIFRVLRDTELTRKIKLLYHNKCQICGKRIKLKKDKYYSEAHHIKPLGKHNGPDTPDNIIILCPDHHVEFDYGVIAIDPITFKIIHKDKENKFIEKKVFLHPSHKLNQEFLEYHIRQIFCGT